MSVTFVVLWLIEHIVVCASIEQRDAKPEPRRQFYG